ncbi:MAG TPA: DUF1080 domain-containing protein [Flavobacteriia bacterium]|jgi:hypothetical protein|nr:DUF1080 domain-containing protein [Flavobacteriia bacterium]
MKRLPYFLTVLLLTVLISCKEKPAKKTENSVATIPQKESEWIYLFDGKDLSGWRGFNANTLPENWVLEEGTLKSQGTGGDIGGDIVYGEKPFEYFELSLEWKISEGGNSGIFYHVHEGKKYKAPYENAPEYQLIDDIGFPQPLEEWQKLGADYAMYPADATQKIVKKAGEWNTSRIVFTKDKAEYWLNGKKVVSFVPYSEDWQKRRNSGKWDKYPDYGKYKKGLIGLQDHGSFIWFKNIKIKEL